MNGNHPEMYSSNSGYYDLSVKEPWVCGKTLYSMITVSSAVLIGIAAACFFVPLLFGNATLTTTGLTQLVHTIQYLHHSPYFSLAFEDVANTTKNSLANVKTTVLILLTLCMQSKQYA